MRLIIVATNLSSASDRALRRGIRLATDIGARLVLLHVGAVPEMASTLDQLAEACAADSGLDCTALTIDGDPDHAIPAKAAELGASLVVFGPHEGSMLQTIATGAGAARALRHASTPILVANGQGAGRYARLLISTDFSPCARAAADTVQLLGLTQGAETILYHAYEPRPHGGIAAALLTKAQRAAEMGEHHKAALLALSDAAASSGLAPNRIIAEPLSASPASMILAKAHQQDADLIVMGAQGKSGLARLFLGSVAEEMLHGIDIDLLVVPPALP